MNQLLDPERKKRIRRRRSRKLLTLATLLAFLGILVSAFWFYWQEATRPLAGGRLVSEEVAPYYSFTISGGPGVLALKQPLGVAASPSGDRVYVADTPNGRIEVFDGRGRLLFAFNKIGAGMKLRLPVYVAVNSMGKLYVTDRLLGGVFVFERDGGYIHQLFPKKNPRFEWQPLAIAFDSEDNIYVTDVGIRQRILVMGLDGKVKKIVDGGSDPLSFANGLAVDKYRNIFVSDSNHGRLRVFNPDGKQVDNYATGGLPRGMTMDGRGRLLVVDSLGQRVKVYDNGWRSLGSFGSGGLQAGAFNFPNGVSTDDDGRVYISDRANNRVEVWGSRVLVAVNPNVTPKVPWILAAIPLVLLIPFLGGAPRFAAHPDFLDKVVYRGEIEIMARRLGPVAVPSNLWPDYKRYRQGKFKLRRWLVPRDQDDHLADTLANEFDLDPDDAAPLALAAEFHHRTTLLVDDDGVRAAATLMGVPTMSFAEFTTAFDRERTIGGVDGTDDLDALGSEEELGRQGPSDLQDTAVGRETEDPWDA